jgi:hypothetical protein
MSDTSTHQIMQDGDFAEKLFWGKFLRDKFPSYEKYWQSKIVPLTNRSLNINF